MMVRAIILVTDADREIAELVAAVLEDDGHRVLRAHDGAAALEALRRDGCHLFVTDTMFPCIDGELLIPYLRDYPDLATPFILLGTTRPIPSPPGTVFVAKPFAVEALSNLVARLLEGPGQPDPPTTT
jgi:two-component system sensor histidine kinase/response regulator